MTKLRERDKTPELWDKTGASAGLIGRKFVYRNSIEGCSGKSWQKIEGKEFTIVALDPRRKNNIVCRDDSGETGETLFNLDLVTRLLEQ